MENFSQAQEIATESRPPIIGRHTTQDTRHKTQDNITHTILNLDTAIRP